MPSWKSPRTSSATLAIFCCLVLTALVFDWQHAHDAPPRPPGVGEVAPPFTLFDIDGNEHTLGEWKGRPVVIVFWAAWSAVSQAQAEAICNLPPSQAGATVDVAFDFVDISEIARLMSKGTASTHLLGRPTPLRAWGGFPTLPYVIALDARGIVRQSRAGFCSAEDLQNLLETLR